MPPTLRVGLTVSINSPWESSYRFTQSSISIMPRVLFTLITLTVEIDHRNHTSQGDKGMTKEKMMPLDINFIKL